MAFPATSPMVVDISGDNDSLGAIAAASAIPSTSMDTGFERSCDNPECSAPKLISLVPKRETPEFITEPIIMSQPTLINGFTTVFQIDGIGARMNDILNGESGSGPGTSNGNGMQLKPKSVFRIVPNTHAHIVNYVVVDGAGETMRKIKANDADTMRKLLESQRISAEQMLKKLVGNAGRPLIRQTEPKVPKPISNKTLMFSTPSANVSATAPVPAPVPIPISGPLPASVLPFVPPGITITPIPMPDVPQSGKSTVVSTSSPTTAVTQTSTKPSLSQASVSTNPQPAATTPILRQALVNTPSDASKNPDRPTFLKRKLVSTPIPDMSKKLRPRSPKHKTPMAVGLNPLSPTPATKKLPTLPKLPTKPPGTAASALAQSTPQPALICTESMDEDDSLTSQESTSKGSEKLTPKSGTESTPVLPTQKLATRPKGSSPAAAVKADSPSGSLPVKVKPLMGPASKMNALKAIAAAKVNAAQADNAEASTKQKAAGPSTRVVTRIGETVITSTARATPKSDVTPMPKTKPCSVSIPKADISTAFIKAREALDEQGASTPKAESASPSKPNVAELTYKKDTKSTQSASTTNVVAASKANATSPRIAVRQSLEVDPLELPAIKPSLPTKGKFYLLKSNTSASNSKGTVPKADGSPVTRISSALASKVNASKADGSLNTKTATASKADGPTLKTTRSSTPKVSGTLPTKPDKLSTPTTRIVTASAKTSETSTTSTTPAQPRTLRVILPTLKNGIMTVPVKSPHPNLKISSVISGGSAVAALGVKAKTSTTTKVQNEIRGPDIEKLQQELLDLRQTVARLTKRP